MPSSSPIPTSHACTSSCAPAIGRQQGPLGATTRSDKTRPPRATQRHIAPALPADPHPSLPPSTTHTLPPHAPLTQPPP
eukprot:2081326-Rhodomonas_salina.1